MRRISNRSGCQAQEEVNELDIDRCCFAWGSISLVDIRNATSDDLPRGHRRLQRLSSTIDEV